MEILKPYIDNKKVTLYDNEYKEKWVDMQTDLYNKYFAKHLDETVWFGIFDLDEFLYSPNCVDIKSILKNNIDCHQIQANWAHFGSSGHIKQPDFVVPNFLYRGEYNGKNNGPNGRYNSYKSIAQTKFIAKLGIHVHQLKDSCITKNLSFSLDNPELVVNHYAIQSKEFWENVKMTRGSATLYYEVVMKWKRDKELFKQMDINDIKDTQLASQNRELYETLCENQE
jgi:hypothetical protein